MPKRGSLWILCGNSNKPAVVRILEADTSHVRVTFLFQMQGKRDVTTWRPIGQLKYEVEPLEALQMIANRKPKAMAAHA